MSYEKTCFVCSVKKDTREYTFNKFQEKILCHMCFKNIKPVECSLCGTEYDQSLSSSLECQYEACSQVCYQIIKQHPYIYALSTKLTKKNLNDSALKNKITDLEETVEKLNAKIDDLKSSSDNKIYNLEKNSSHHKFLTDIKLANLLEKLNQNKISFDGKIDNLVKTVTKNKPKPNLSLSNLMRKSANTSNKKIKKYEIKQSILQSEIDNSNEVVRIHDNNFNLYKKNIENLKYLISAENKTSDEDIVYYCKCKLAMEDNINKYESNIELIKKIKFDLVEKNKQLKNIRKNISTNTKEFNIVSTILAQ
jgi:hypothetical protein